jgi:ABC-type Na+ efflux pump permease subunit
MSSSVGRLFAANHDDITPNSRFHSTAFVHYMTLFEWMSLHLHMPSITAQCAECHLLFLRVAARWIHPRPYVCFYQQLTSILHTWILLVVLRVSSGVCRFFENFSSVQRVQKAMTFHSFFVLLAMCVTFSCAQLAAEQHSTLMEFYDAVGAFTLCRPDANHHRSRRL